MRDKKTSQAFNKNQKHLLLFSMENDSRLKILENYKILDTLPEAEFDELVKIASAICDTPIYL
jgi:hypothetical protein